MLQLGRIWLSLKTGSPKLDAPSYWFHRNVRHFFGRNTPFSDILRYDHMSHRMGIFHMIPINHFGGIPQMSHSMVDLFSIWAGRYIPTLSEACGGIEMFAGTGRVMGQDGRGKWWIYDGFMMVLWWIYILWWIMMNYDGGLWLFVRIYMEFWCFFQDLW